MACDLVFKRIDFFDLDGRPIARKEKAQARIRDHWPVIISRPQQLAVDREQPPVADHRVSAGFRYPPGADGGVLIIP
jgi:hypothetical protein